MILRIMSYGKFIWCVLKLKAPNSPAIYRYTSPEISNTGLYLLGESNKFVPVSPKRVKEISYFSPQKSKTTVTVRIVGKAKEEVTMHFVHVSDIERVLTTKCILDESGEALVDVSVSVNAGATLECMGL